MPQGEVVQDKLHAVIGIWLREGRAFYVKRSENEKLNNYLGVWSLFSIQYEEGELEDVKDLSAASRLMQKMTEERLCGSPIRTKGFLFEDSANSMKIINKWVYLKFYEIEFDNDPKLNPDYYTDGRWMTFDEYEEQLGEGGCGSCIRMWWDYAHFNLGIVNRPFQRKDGNI